MEFSFIYITVLFVSLLASIFVVVTNSKDSKKSLISLDFRIVAIQLIILLAWIIVLSKALKATNPEEAIINVTVFIFSLVIGILVIQSVVKENKASEITKKLVQSLSIYNRRLRSLDKQKTDFVSTASHQLRSPNSVILGYSSMLLEGDYGKISVKQRDVLQNIFNASANLNSIINDLLDTTRIEQGTIKFESEEFDIIDIIEEATQSFKDLAKKKSISFVEDFNPNYSIQIRGDKDKIKQVIMNLLDNSIKYTSKGTITVSVAKKEQKVHICVSDTGIGIREDELSGIFNKFSRASNAESINVLGSGLGLFIAREIVLANKGKIWVESDGQGKGSKFYVEFNLLK